MHCIDVDLLRFVQVVSVSFNEDRVMVESQRPEDLPLDITMEAHIAADRTSIAYRKLLKDSGLGALYFS